MLWLLFVASRSSWVSGKAVLLLKPLDGCAELGGETPPPAYTRMAVPLLKKETHSHACNAAFIT